MARTKSTARKSTGGMSRYPPAPRKGTGRQTQNSSLAQPQLPARTTDRVLRSDTVREASLAKAAEVTKRRSRHRKADPWTRKKPARKGPPRPRAPPATHYTCRICIEEQTVDQFPRWVPLKRHRWNVLHDIPFNCIQHLARNPRKKHIDPVCKSCIGNSMSARLDTVGARQIGTGCLEPGCTENWHYDYIMRYIPRGEPLEKFNMEMFDVWLETTTPKPIKCISSTCEAIGLPDIQAPGYPQITCHQCSIRACAQCQIPWHENVTCAEHAAKQVDEKMSDPEKETLELMQSKDGKRCPNCHLVIEKDGGCDSMFCMGCKKYFNWTTAASAVLGAKKPQPYIHDMPYWSGRADLPCEMDGILKAAESAAAAPVVAAAS